MQNSAMRITGNVHEDCEKSDPQATAELHRRWCGSKVEGQLQFIYGVSASFIHPWRLTCRTDENPGKKVRERRMVQPISDETLEQVRAAEERTVRWQTTAQSEVIAASGSGMPAIEHELLCP